MSFVLGIAPALPLHTAGKYVAAAYIVFLALVLIYVAIMATRLGRIERDLDELQRDVLAQRGDHAAGAVEHTGREREPVA